MSKEFKKKNISLAFQFSQYLIAKPERLLKMPGKSRVFFTVKGDNAFNRQSRSLAETMKTRRYKKIVEARKEGARWKIFAPAVV